MSRVFARDATNRDVVSMRLSLFWSDVYQSVVTDTTLLLLLVPFILQMSQKGNILSQLRQKQHKNKVYQTGFLEIGEKNTTSYNLYTFKS